MLTRGLRGQVKGSSVPMDIYTYDVPEASDIDFESSESPIQFLCNSVSCSATLRSVLLSRHTPRPDAFLWRLPVVRHRPSVAGEVPGDVGADAVRACRVLGFSLATDDMSSRPRACSLELVADGMAARLASRGLG